MTAVYGSQSTPQVLMVVSTFKAKHQTLFFLQWLLQWSTTTNKNILTIQTVNYFDEIGHFAFVNRRKSPVCAGNDCILQLVMLLSSPLTTY